MQSDEAAGSDASCGGAALKRVAHALSHGQSISILNRDQEISTQQAAEILGLSRRDRGQLEVVLLAKRLHDSVF